MVEARFPRLKRLEDFDLAAAPGINPASLAALGTGGWIDAGEPVVLLGDSGTGKSHLLIGLGIAACETGRRVCYYGRLQPSPTLSQSSKSEARALSSHHLPRAR